MNDSHTFWPEHISWELDEKVLGGIEWGKMPYARNIVQLKYHRIEIGGQNLFVQIPEKFLHAILQ